MGRMVQQVRKVLQHEGNWLKTVPPASQERALTRQLAIDTVKSLSATTKNTGGRPEDEERLRLRLPAEVQLQFGVVSERGNSVCVGNIDTKTMTLTLHLAKDLKVTGKTVEDAELRSHFNTECKIAVALFLRRMDEKDLKMPETWARDGGGGEDRGKDSDRDKGKAAADKGKGKAKDGKGKKGSKKGGKDKKRRDSRW